MRRLFVAALLLVAPPAAQARSFSVPARVAVPFSFGTKSLALADGQVLWMEQRGAAAALVAAGEDGVAHDVATLPPLRTARPTARLHSVVAAGTNAFVQRFVCADSGCSRDIARELVRVDLATGAAAPFDGCFGDEACRDRCDGPLRVGLRGSVLAIDGRCTSRGTVSDLADGTTRRFSSAVEGAAGRFAVLDGGPQLRVVDWRTGAVVSDTLDGRADQEVDDVGIGEDGTIAWVVGSSLQVLPPGAARPRRVRLGRGGFPAHVGIAGGRLAIRLESEDDTTVLQLSDLDGEGARRVSGERGFGFGFDGTRLAWVARPCEQTVVQVWDFADAPPPPAPARCLLPFIDRRSVRLGRRRATVPVRLTCPPEPATGCGGRVGVEFFKGSRKVAETGRGVRRLRAGATHSEQMPVLERALRRVRGPLTARVEFRTFTGESTVARIHVRG